MKKILSAGLLLLFMACNNNNTHVTALEMKVDSLEKQLGQTYRPGFGEFMSNIQAHHIKLWFAGINKNWELADFEMHEIGEILQDIRVFDADRKESEMTTMLDPALDSVNQAITKKDPAAFQSAYVFLTNTCNNCHKENDFGFNVVTIPQSQPFSNQEFRKPD